MRFVSPRHLACLFGLLLPLAGGCDKEDTDLCEADECMVDSDTQDTDDSTTDDSTTDDSTTESESEGETEDTEGETTEGETTEGEDDCENGVCEGEACEIPNETVDCGDGGLRYCSRTSDSWEFQWGGCVTGATECELGESKSCFEGEDVDITMNCTAIDGEPQWDWEDCNTPLVLAFDNEPVALTASAANFDIAGNGCVSTDWPTEATPWLALDRDRNGSIDGGHELFGNGTVMSGGMKAKHGFAALSELDSNHDGRVTSADARWSELVLWADHDRDKVSTMWELTPVGEHGVTAIELSYWRNPLCDARQNCEVERASFTYEDRSGRSREGSVVDIYLACQ